jgi:hypothetical protein
MGLFLLDQVFEDADVFCLQNLDGERLIQLDRFIRVVTENETFEQEKLRRIGFFRDIRRFKERSEDILGGAFT